MTSLKKEINGDKYQYLNKEACPFIQKRM